METLENYISDFFSNVSLIDGVALYCIYITRWLLPVFALWVLIRCVRSMLRERYEPETWAFMAMEDRGEVPVRHWESIIGRARSSDITVDDPTVSRTHAALIRDSEGTWTIFDLDSASGTVVSGKRVPDEGTDLSDGNKVRIGKAEMVFYDMNKDELEELSMERTAPGRYIRPGLTFLILTIFQVLVALQHSVTASEEYTVPITLAFIALILTMWSYYFIMRSIRRTGFEVETIAFFLSTLGLSVVASSAPEDMLKQTILMLVGIALFLVLGWWLRDLTRAKKLLWPAMIGSVALLGLNLILGEELFGAKNWISIGSFSLQPSEFVKIAYIYACTATLDRLYRNRNVLLFIGFSAICVGALALMGDFGTALVFFATFLVISYLRSGNLTTVLLAVTSAGLAGMLMLTIKPHIAARFATWGHIWEVANEGGYQQTRALSAAASGGFFGLGAGNGWLESIVAADTDLVFCLVSEELGLIIAVLAVVAVIALAAFTVKNAAQGRSSFYVIAACAAVSMMMAQMALNVFGAVDILPFTGVTFPFVSKGGSSLICCWALLAFIKAGDTRQNASFVVKLAPSEARKPPRKRGKEETDA